MAPKVPALPWNEWQGSSGIRAYPVKIREMDVSNGPESGRNLAAILDRQTASLCHFASFLLRVPYIPHEFQSSENAYK